MDRISAFMDGETSRGEAHQTLLRLKQNDTCRETWDTFHLIGDVMRGNPELRDGFVAQLHQRIEQEPTQLAPGLNWRKSTNFALSAAASVAAISIVLALGLTDNPLSPQIQIADAPKTKVIADNTPTIARPRPTTAANQGKINEYLMAHQEFSPSTAFQGVAPYVRTVSATHDGSGK